MKPKIIVIAGPTASRKNNSFNRASQEDRWRNYFL